MHVKAKIFCEVSRFISGWCMRDKRCTECLGGHLYFVCWFLFYYVKTFESLNEWGCVVNGNSFINIMGNCKRVPKISNLKRLLFLERKKKQGERFKLESYLKNNLQTNERTLDLFNILMPNKYRKSRSDISCSRTIKSKPDLSVLSVFGQIQKLLRNRDHCASGFYLIGSRITHIGDYYVG